MRLKPTKASYVFVLYGGLVVRSPFDNLLQNTTGFSWLTVCENPKVVATDK